MQHIPDKNEVEQQELASASFSAHRQLTPRQFIRREEQFFRGLLNRRSSLTGEQLRLALETHLRENTVFAQNYGLEVNHKWTQLLSDFLVTTGLRLECLKEGCSAPSIPRYLPAVGKTVKTFRTEHYDDSGKQQRHGGRTTIPFTCVVFAKPNWEKV